MSIKIACYTLFDITETGVLNRSTPPVIADVQSWTLQRNTQCNYDTVLQIISLRSQPETIQSPQKIVLTTAMREYFGTNYRWTKKSCCWQFVFSVQHSAVFNNGIDELGALYSDSNGVPMILTNTVSHDIGNTLSTARDRKNIHYMVIEND